MKLSSFLIAMAVCGLFVSVLLSFLSGVSNEYAPNIDAGTTNNLSALNKLTVIQNNTETIESQVFSQQDAGGITDLLGKYLGAGYQSLKLVRNSFSAFYDMVDTAFSNSFLGAGLGSFKATIIIIAMIIIVFTIIAVLVGRDNI